MVYHTAYILLCGPFLPKHSDPKTDPKTESTTQEKQEPKDPQTEKAVTLCSASCRAMCIIAQRYRQTFGSFKLSPMTATHCILCAALIIIEKCCTVENLKQYNPVDKPQPSASPHASVGLCLQVLRELSSSWNIAKRIGRNLERAYCQRFGPDAIPSLPENYDPAPFAPAGQTTDLGISGDNVQLPLDAFDGVLDDKNVLFGNPPPFHVENSLAFSQHPTFERPDIPNFGPGDPNVMPQFPTSDELFANNLGFAFSPDCLPSDYNMFDTLNQMYVEEKW